MKTKHWIMVFVGLALVLLAILLLRPKQSGLVGIYRDGRLIETVDLTKDRTIPLDGAAGRRDRRRTGRRDLHGVGGMPRSDLRGATGRSAPAGRRSSACRIA